MCPWGVVSCKNTAIYKWRAGNYCITYYGEEAGYGTAFEIKGIVTLKIDKQSN